MKAHKYFFLAIFLVACKGSEKIPDQPDYGKIENGIYRNRYFDFELPVPATWFVQNRGEQKRLQEMSQQMIAANNKEVAAEALTSGLSSAILLTVFKYVTDSTNKGEFNPSFTIVAENLGTLPVHNGKEYLGQSRDLMQQSGISYRFAGDIQDVKLGNEDFAAMDVSLNGARQTYYSTVKRNFALSIIISVSSDEEQNELEAIVGALKFN